MCQQNIGVYWWVNNTWNLSHLKEDLFIVDVSKETQAEIDFKTKPKHQLEKILAAPKCTKMCDNNKFL